MLTDLLSRINWIDILIVVLFLRLFITAAHNGLFVELFKLCGTILSFFLSLHYFDIVTDAWVKAFGGKKEADLIDLISFIFLAGLGYGLLLAVRFVFIRSKRRPEEIAWYEQAASALFACARAVLVAALVMFGVMATRLVYFQHQVQKSFIGPSMLAVVPSVYSSLWDTVWSKSALHEQSNDLVYSIAGGK